MSDLRDFIQKHDPTSIGLWVVEYDRLVEQLETLERERDEWHNKALDWEQAKSEADSAWDDAEAQLRGAKRENGRLALEAATADRDWKQAIARVDELERRLEVEIALRADIERFEELREAARKTLDEYDLWAEDANDGEFAIWSRDALMASFVALRQALAALTVSKPTVRKTAEAEGRGIGSPRANAPSATNDRSDSEVQESA